MKARKCQEKQRWVYVMPFPQGEESGEVVKRDAFPEGVVAKPQQANPRRIWTGATRKLCE